MDVKEFEQQDRQEENRKTVKTVAISAGGTLLFIIIILLLVILGLKNCSNVYGYHGSSSSSSEEGYHYDNELLNNQFIKIVNYERLVAGYDDVPTDVVAVTYVDNYPNSFNISITAKAGNTIYYYHLDNYLYSGDISSYDNCIGYIYSLNITDRLNSNAVIQSSVVTNQTIDTDKGNHYVISDATPIKYFSGFYLDNNQYKIYNYIEFTSGDNPFNSEPSFKVNSNDPLYGYYQSLKV